MMGRPFSVYYSIQLMQSSCPVLNKSCLLRRYFTALHSLDTLSHFCCFSKHQHFEARVSSSSGVVLSGLVPGTPYRMVVSRDSYGDDVLLLNKSVSQGKCPIFISPL